MTELMAFYYPHPLAVLPSSPVIPMELYYLLLILGLLIFMWDFFDRRSKSVRKGSGLQEKSEVISLRGGHYLPSREFYSERLRLASKPDALVREDGFIIPVEVKPLSKKVRDRHVVSLMLSMKLIEELEGKRPPYGILLLGKDSRLIRIKNTEEKQLWIDALIAEMRSIAQGIPANPVPSTEKCRNCDVREICEHSAYHPTDKLPKST